MHAYVINLARSRDRRAYITAHLNQIGIDHEIVTGIDGHSLDLSDQRIIAPEFHTNAYLTAGSAGCALSHLAVYRKIIEDGLDVALVLEDDVILPADLDDLTDAIGRELSGAEVALVSVDSREPLKVSTQGAASLPSSRFLAFPIDVFQPRSGGAYMITRAACERMIKHNVPIRTPADDWGFFYSEGILDRIRCVLPVPAKKNHNFSSTIGSYKLGSGPLGRLMAAAMRHRIPVLHQMMARRRSAIYHARDLSVFTDEPFVNTPSRLDFSDLPSPTNPTT